LIPSVTHVFSTKQHLYLYYEVYDLARAGGSADQARVEGGSSQIRLMTNVAFFRGKVKTYETPLLETKELTAPGRSAAVFQLDVPLSNLKSGFYTCQVNVIDAVRDQFTFPRLALLVRD
jgi:hypothetical protein